MTNEENFVITLRPENRAYHSGDQIVSSRTIAEVEAIAATARVSTVLETWHDSFVIRSKRAIRATYHLPLVGATSVTPLVVRRRKCQFGIMDLPSLSGKLTSVGAGVSAKPLMHGTRR
ncbi:hypothetical protein [Mycobacterium sp. IDR2000157661]|uniref:hypothetical protein n=1 Tax=Mycobacterium sp. IDR2000157661 TaxID=2867005 RepID=UPI001EEA9CAC|nr:hypothetical protein [Mycobacterium sp. IDR2000157661]ULE33956.1 hypothetical protein K3G64_04495 [Mycobacterium sp. IDR2000157661]